MLTLSLLIFCLTIAHSIAQDDKVITCYAYDGTEHPASSKCPGSNACCGLGATCLSNRLCYTPKEGPGMYVRGSCATYPYDSGSCAQICLYNETTGYLPRVRTCSDGSLCCDNDIDCCNKGRGIFLDEKGQLADSAPSTMYSYGPERTASTFRISGGSIATQVSSAVELESTPTSTSTSTSSASPDTKSTESTNMGVKIGLGVAIPVLCLTLIGFGVWFWRRNRRATAHSARPEEVNQMTHEAPNESRYLQYGARPFSKYELPARVEPAELDGGYKT